METDQKAIQRGAIDKRLARANPPWKKTPAGYTFGLKAAKDERLKECSDKQEAVQKELQELKTKKWLPPEISVNELAVGKIGYLRGTILGRTKIDGNNTLVEAFDVPKNAKNGNNVVEVVPQYLWVNLPVDKIVELGSTQTTIGGVTSAEFIIYHIGSALQVTGKKKITFKDGKMAEAWILAPVNLGDN